MSVLDLSGYDVSDGYGAVIFSEYAGHGFYDFIMLFGAERIYLGDYSTIIGTQAGDNIEGTRIGSTFGVDLYGMGGDDVLYGGVGASYLDGGEGNDQLIGRSAGDVLVGGNGDDVIGPGGGADTINGGAGTDTVFYYGAVTVNLRAGTGPNGTQISGVENLQGSVDADRLTGSDGANRLDGSAGNDVLDGGAGDDVLRGGGGADSLSGGSGTDRADYEESSAGVTVSLVTNTGAGGTAEGDVLSSIETIDGSRYNDVLTGNGLANKLWGNDGNDTLNGSDGDDSLYGEGGADTLVGDAGNDWLIGGAGGDMLDGGAGTDTANYAEAGGAVTLSLLDGAGTGGDAAGDSFVSVENVLGSVFADWIKGDGGANGLWGLAGNDRLYGAGGNDTLSGGDGDDAVYGEAGADVLNGGEGNDSLTGGAGADALSGGNGIDVAQYDAAAASVTVNLATGSGTAGDAAGDTYSSIENVLGSAHNDTITGNAAANAFWGMAGSDVLVGGGGADALKGGAGADIFVYRAVSDSAPTARDSINDFSHTEGDRIDLGAVDADGNAGNGDTAFTFLGSGAFTGAGHELRLQFSGGVQVVLADLNGDKVADMAISVTSTTTLIASDFVL